MERNIKFRALALLFTATLAVSSVDASELSFFSKHKKVIIAGTVVVLTAAAAVYYFRSNLLEIGRGLLKGKAKNEANTENTKIVNEDNASGDTEPGVTPAPEVNTENTKIVNEDNDSGDTEPVVETQPNLEEATSQVNSSPIIKDPEERFKETFNELKKVAIELKTITNEVADKKRDQLIEKFNELIAKLADKKTVDPIVGPEDKFIVYPEGEISRTQPLVNKIYNSYTTLDEDVLKEFKVKHGLVNVSE